MRPLTLVTACLSVLLSAAIFGFFYAWVCSTMWGLDAADPRVAIATMQAMNGSVRNIVFAPAFFGTPVALAASALLLLRDRHRRAARAFGAAGAVYFCLAFMVTAIVNVPMNEALASIQIPDATDAARQIWRDYSQPWQVWNLVRTISSGTALLIALAGLLQLGCDARSAPANATPSQL